MALALAGTAQVHSSSPAAAAAPLGLECDRTSVLEQLPLPEPLALTGTKVTPGEFLACLQPLQHHQTSLWVLQELQRQQQTWLNSRTPQLYFPVFITASLLHQ